MTQFTQENALTRFIGPPPGYQGFHTGGQLTEAIKKQPYSVVLLDEIDKANPHVLRALMRALDEGAICDAKGHNIDCSNVVFILTSNSYAKLIETTFEEGTSEEELIPTLKRLLCIQLFPEFVGRLKIIPFRNISQEILNPLIERQLQEVKNTLIKNEQISLKWSQKL